MELLRRPAMARYIMAPQTAPATPVQTLPWK
jgi:hypothetical protein